MSTGYSGTPLVKKLGIKPGFRIAVLNAPQNYFEKTLGPLPEGVDMQSGTKAGEMDFVQYFTKSKRQLLEDFPMLKAALKKTGMLWISWPKKASKVPTDVDDALVRETGLQGGLVDVKVCAVDMVWSGLKFVYRTKDRR